MKNVICIENLHYSYGTKQIYNNLSLDVLEGSVYGILGKNGVGKSTLINILMGYTLPQSGKCLVLGEPSSNISSKTRAEIALLHEGFIGYDFMSIEQLEHFFAPFYKKWNKKIFYDLVDLMGLCYTQKLSTLSFGQKSQVILGTIFAQDAKLLILDDYSMGLDAGYRKLFIEYLKNYILDKNKTVLITSHVMGDLVGLIDEMIIVQKGGSVYKQNMQKFLNTFRCYDATDKNLENINYHRLENLQNKKLIYTFEKLDNFQEIECDFEDKFLGFVGKY